MKWLAIAMLLSTPAMADMGGGPPLMSGKSEPVPPPAPGGVTSSGAFTGVTSSGGCSPIGQTLRGELVFPLGCPVEVNGPVSVTVPAGK